MALTSVFLGETARLLIRPWQFPQDLTAAWEIYSDPKVMAFILHSAGCSPKIVIYRY